MSAEPNKMWGLLRSIIVAIVVIDFTFVPVLTQCLSLNKWNLKIIRQVMKRCMFGCPCFSSSRNACRKFDRQYHRLNYQRFPLPRL